MKLACIIFIALWHPGIATYVWPARFDYLEDLYAMYIGSIKSGFTDRNHSGRGLRPIENAAERVRTAFHDSITYSKKTRRGGLDASIMFELDRDENKGAAFNNTLNAVRDLVTAKSSVADLLALSLAASSVTCEGPQIPLRFGRIDAQAAGPAGVPLPTDSVEVATRAFVNAGFTQEEMITLVACGHTLGRVHSVDFPNLVEGAPSQENNADFDTTRLKFDNLVVTEFLSNNTKNPLVIAKDETFHSDKRIFSIGNRAVMQKLNDPTTYQKQCATLLERMINTVPGNVKLSAPVAPIDMKPYITTLQLQDDGNILFEGRLRFRSASFAGQDPKDLAVSLRLTTFDRSKTNLVVQAAPATFSSSANEVFAWFEFSTVVAGRGGIRSFEVQTKSKSQAKARVVTYNNAGTGGYPVNTNIMYQLTNSCLDTSASPGKLTIVAAMRRSRFGPRRGARAGPQLHLSRLVPRPGVMIPRLQADVLRMQKTQKQIGQYDIYRIETQLESPSWSSTFALGTMRRPARDLLFLKELSAKKCEEL
ncbi:heme peroxidase [Myriangium duriaei CBS 260.36]|uniref:Peroxidase n=1 Tax=Myriangium duriaei CBS 260.36 TaxID=1168546 RepID=A0A9P4J8Q4_9PEZI|nr:heme peroxidase [Myriangium duriaei CBS 260.36]